ncbi:MAG: alanine--glyoxylate aminotransferase family protein, partial [Gemmatimonadales bacterium]|nr:alanine--glyoxylate aminotransferase family protein [Gemmatimonadales bacterium]
PSHKPTTGFGRFFLPGPTEVRPEILAAQAQPMIGHRGSAIQELIGRVQPGLKRVFGTVRPVYISSSSATGLMEAAVRSCARKRVLALVNGAFSGRFRAIAESNGLEVDALEVSWGEGHPPEMLEEALKRESYDAVTVVHSETSTGALNPVAELAEVVHRHEDVLLLVDSVTGVGGAPMAADRWRLDFVLTGSQKALALPPGLAFGVAQESALRRAETIPFRGTYFDIVAFEGGLAKHQTPNTPAISLLYALQAQLERIDAETITGRCARHRAMAERVWEWVETMADRGAGLSMLAPEGYRSPTVSCIRLPEGLTGPEITAKLGERGFTIAPGYGKLKDPTIRIGHMGDHTIQELDELLEQLEGVLTE